jgi:hypothetical protein
MAVYRALAGWTQAAGIKSASEWARCVGGPRLVAEIERLNSDLFSGRGASADWKATSLEDELVKARKDFLRPRIHRRDKMLPALNPFWKSEALS